MMKNLVYRRYHNLRYIFRLKHYKGRDIHSPFMYSLMRGALMGSHSKLTEAMPLYRELRQCGYKRNDAGKIARIYNFMNMTSYQINKADFCGEELSVMPHNVSYEMLSTLIKSIDSSQGVTCVVVPAIYKSRSSRAMWTKILSEHNIVGVDIFTIGLIFVSDILQKQNYKIKI